MYDDGAREGVFVDETNRAGILSFFSASFGSIGVAFALVGGSSDKSGAVLRTTTGLLMILFMSALTLTLPILR